MLLSLMTVKYFWHFWSTALEREFGIPFTHEPVIMSSIISQFQTRPNRFQNTHITTH